MDSPVSKMASTAATAARPMIRPLLCSGMPLSMMERNSSGLTTPITASTITNTRNQARMLRYGRANCTIRLAVPLVTRCWVTESSRRMERMTPPNWPPPPPMPMPWPGMLIGTFRGWAPWLGPYCSRSELPCVAPAGQETRPRP